MNISEFERNKPKETLKQINLLIKMQKVTDKKIGGGPAGAEIQNITVQLHRMGWGRGGSWGWG